MRILLDENFPLQLFDRLRKEGARVEHVLLFGRGMPDAAIRARLAAEEDLLLVTQDSEFLDFGREYKGAVLVSLVPQRLPIAQRVEIWWPALAAFLDGRPAGHLFELLESGEVVPWEILDR